MASNPNTPPTHEEVDRKLTEGRVIMISHIDTRFDQLRDLIKSGFPGGDPAKHREVHEALIRDAEDRRTLWKAVREKTITGGVYSAVIFIALAVWESVKSGVIK